MPKRHQAMREQQAFRGKKRGNCKFTNWWLLVFMGFTGLNMKDTAPPIHRIKQMIVLDILFQLPR